MGGSVGSDLMSGVGFKNRWTEEELMKMLRLCWCLITKTESLRTQVHLEILINVSRKKSDLQIVSVAGWRETERLNISVHQVSYRPKCIHPL